MSDKCIHCQLPASLRAILNCIVSAGCRSLDRLEIGHQLLIESGKFNNMMEKKKKCALQLNNSDLTAWAQQCSYLASLID